VCAGVESTRLLAMLVRVYVHACIYVCMYKRICVHVLYVCIYDIIHMQRSTVCHGSMCVCMYVYICAYVRIYI